MNLIRKILVQARTWGLKGVVTAIARIPHERRIRRFLVDNARRNVETRPMRGVTVIAPMSGAFSLSKAMRDFVTRLQVVGVPHQVFDTFQYDGRVSREDYESLLTPKDDFNILKYDHVVEMLTSPLPHGLPVKRCRIAFWEGETGILETFPYLVDSDVVIAMSDYNAKYYRREFPSSVRVAKVLYPLLPIPKGILSKEEARNRFALDLNDFIVFYNFDLRAGFRKNPEGTLNAFASAFRGVPHCRLLLKINGIKSERKRLEELEKQADRLGIARQMTLVTGYLSQMDLYSLTNACDVYLSLHRSEGFGLGIAEAMQLSKPVIVTAYSAPLEFCNGETALLVPYKMIPYAEHSFADRMITCAEADTERAAEALKNLYEDQLVAASIGRRASEYMKTHYSNTAFRTSVEEMLSV